MSPLRKRHAAVLNKAAVAEAKRRFREIFPRAFRDETYIAWERDYKQHAHDLWERLLGKPELERLLAARKWTEIGDRAIAVYQQPKLNLLALYEWMALRDALKDEAGAARFAPALHQLIYGKGPFAPRFDHFVDILDGLPQRQTRLAKWPVATLYPFIAQPEQHLLLKPNLVKNAAKKWGFDLGYASRPTAEIYARFMQFVDAVEAEIASWKPRDRIDTQGFIWVTNSEEYETWPWDHDDDDDDE